MIKVGITGQSGFVGSHLYNFLGLHENIKRVTFEDSFFSDEKKLNEFVGSCDAIVHLAAMNRHNDQDELYKTNISLVRKLIDAMESENTSPHILFSSSIQEERDNPYGRSKKEGRELFIKWAERNNGRFTGFVIPNVFGPFGHPYYNSVVATFCHQLTHDENPKIDVDGQMKLIYVQELVEIIFDTIINKKGNNKYHVAHTSETKVSELLKKLEEYKDSYFNEGKIPRIKNRFDSNLFNTFRCYIDQESFFPFALTKHTDERGSFVETIKSNIGGQISFSTTKPGITRGNHFHTRKIERFAVIKGEARIEMRRIGTDQIHSFELSGDNPAFVDMPIWYTHNITNIGHEELYTIFWINEFFDPGDPDTFYEKVKEIK